MKHKTVWLGIIMTLMLAMLASAADNKTLQVNDDLTIQFGTINDCKADGTTWNESETSVWQITNKDYTIVRYIYHCKNATITAQYIDPDEEQIDVDEGGDKGQIKDSWRLEDDRFYDSGDEDEISSKIQYEMSDNQRTGICTGVEEGGSSIDGLNGNLSFCYGALTTLIEQEKACKADAELRAEYGARLEACEADVAEKDEALTKTTEEKDSFSSQINSAVSEKDSCKEDLTQTKANFNTCQEASKKFEEESGQRILYGIVGLLAGIVGMNMYKKGQTPHPGASNEEREFDWD